MKENECADSKKHVFLHTAFINHTKNMRKCIGFCILEKLHGKMQKSMEKSLKKSRTAEKPPGKMQNTYGLFQQCENPFHRRSGILCAAEGSDADIPFATGTKACAGGCDNASLGQ